MPTPSNPIPQLSLSTTFVVVGARITASALLNASTLPILRNGIACISGASATDIYASSTTDIVYKPSNALTVSSAYAGNTKQTPTVCSTTNPSTQSLTAPVLFTTDQDKAVAITMTIGIRAPASRLLQTTTENATNIVGSLGDAYAAQVATILQSLSNNMGYTDPLASANTNGVYNYSDILYQVSTDGLSPPTEFVMEQLGGWANMLGADTRIAQLSSIVIKNMNKILVISGEDASIVANTLLTNTPPLTNSGSAIPPSNKNTIVGAVVGSLAVIGVLTASVLFFVRRRSKKQVIPLSKSKAIREIYTAYDHPMFKQEVMKHSWEPISTNDISSLATRWKKEQSSRIVKQPNDGHDEVAETVKAAEPSAASAKIALNSLQFLQQYKSAPNLQLIVTGKTSAAVDDANGRRAFTSSGARNIIPPQNRKASSSSTEEDAKAAVMPESSPKPSPKPLPKPLPKPTSSKSSHKPIKLSAPTTLSAIATRYINAIQNKEPVEPDSAIPSEEAPVDSEKKKKKRKSSRRVVDETAMDEPLPVAPLEAAPEPPLEQTIEPALVATEKPAKKVKKSKSSHEETGIQPSKSSNSLVSQESEGKEKKSKRSLRLEIIEPATIDTEPEKKLKKSKKSKREFSPENVD